MREGRREIERDFDVTGCAHMCAVNSNVALGVSVSLALPIAVIAQHLPN